MITNLALDTNIWIYIAKNKYPGLYERLNEMRKTGEIKIITNDIIILEWTRNKDKTMSDISSSIKTEYLNARKLADFLNGDERKEYLKILDAYNSEENRIKIAEERVTQVESFMHSCEQVQITEDQKMFVANLAITGEEPFKGKKNNFNDILILRNFLEHVDDCHPNLHDLIYVSNNPKDFSDSNGDIYKNILTNVGEIKIKTTTQLGEALNISSELTDDWEDWVDYMVEREAYDAFDISRGK